MRDMNMSDAELDAVAGGDGRVDKGGAGGVAGISDAELDAVAGGDGRVDKGGAGGVAG